MLSQAPRLLVLMTGLLLAFAGYSHLRAQGLRQQAAVVAQASQQAAAEFSATFQGAHQEKELKLLDQRRALLLQGSRWSRASMLLLGLAILTLFAAWVARELRAIRRSIYLEGDPRPSPSPKA